MKLKLKGKEGTYIKIRGISLYGNHEIIEREQGLREKYCGMGEADVQTRKEDKLYFNIRC